MQRGIFLERPNRFLAYAELMGQKETIHVKNTGRCAELLKPGAAIYVQESDNRERKTKWDLICVEKGERLVNMDSQIPNKAVQEWIEEGNLFDDVYLVKPETVYGNSRFDLYVEAGVSGRNTRQLSEGKCSGNKVCNKESDEKEQLRRIFIEVKGVTLEENGVVRFPDAPSDRAVKHLEELCRAVKDGYEAYVFFVIQMKGVRYFTPNADTHPAFCETLKKAREAGVHVLAYDCIVTSDSIHIDEEIPVVLGSPILKESVKPLVTWYRENHRQLPWRENPDAYRVWVSEIMLQQTRVEAVKPYYERFLNAFPNVAALAGADEDKLMKMWEGLGYYNRARNMQRAAQQVMDEHNGIFPQNYDEIRKLSGIGNYTAGAISSFAYGIPKPAVDGNVLRVVSRLLASSGDIMKASVRTEIENLLEEVIPGDAAGDFNQGLIELGAIVCVPNGGPKCVECPLAHLCCARAQGIQEELPIRAKAKKRRIEKRTVLIFRDGETVAIRKRPSKGLLAGLYELPNMEGHLTRKEVIEYGKSIGLTPIRVKKLAAAKHIFSHVEWHMIGYEVLVDELEKNCGEKMVFAEREEISEKYSIPSAFEAYMK